MPPKKQKNQKTNNNKKTHPKSCTMLYYTWRTELHSDKFLI